MSDDLQQVIEPEIAPGRAASEAEIIAAANEGIADIEAGRFVLIEGLDDMRRLRDELRESLAPQTARRA